jgi:hypothetical protein
VSPLIAFEGLFGESRNLPTVPYRFAAPLALKPYLNLTTLNIKSA